MKFRVAVGAPSLLIGCWVGALQELIRLRLDCRLIETLRKGSVLGSSPANKHGVTQDEEQSKSPSQGAGRNTGQGQAGKENPQTQDNSQAVSHFSSVDRPVLGRRPFFCLLGFWVGALL